MGRGVISGGIGQIAAYFLAAIFPQNFNSNLVAVLFYINL